MLFFFLGRFDVGDGSGSRISNGNVEWSRIHNLKSFDQSKITHNFRFYNSTIDIAISAFLSNDIFIICTWSNWYKQNKFFRDLLFCTVLNNNKSSTLYHVHICVHLNPWWGFSFPRSPSTVYQNKIEAKKPKPHTWRYQSAKIFFIGFTSI